MGLTVTKEPSEVFLSGNEAKFEVQVTGWDITDVYSALWIGLGMPTQMSQASYNLPAFTLAWNGITENIFLAINPGNSGTQIPRSNEYATLTAYLEAVIVKLKLNPRLVADFAITRANTAWGGYADYIILTALRRGSQFNITFTKSNLNNCAGNAISFDPAAANPGRASMTVLKSASSFLVSKNFIGSSLLSSFDIAPYCRDKKTGHFSFPEITSVYKIHDILTPVQASLGHIDDITGIDTKLVLSSYKYALDGKFSELKQSFLNNAGQNFLQYLDAGGTRKFLTFSPRPKTTDIYAPEKLYFLVPETGTYKILIKKYYKGTTREVYSETISFTKNQVIEIQASYKSITTYDPYIIYNYDICVTDANGYPVSETFQFIVDRDYKAFARYFLFKNSFGVYECIRTTGKISKTTGISKTFADVSDPASMTSLARRMVQLSVNQDVEYEIVTGYKHNDHNEWVTEFFSSADVLFLKNTLAIPCSITESKDASDIDDRKPQSRKAKMKHLYYEDFSHEATAEFPLLPDFNSDFNKDFNSYSFAQTADYYGLAQAGADQSISILTGTLAATALQEGMTGKWTKVSGPGTVTFADDTSNASGFTLGAYGTYVLRWTVTFGSNVEYDDVTIVSTQFVASVNAGTDQMLTALSGSLVGSGNITDPLWTRISGPGSVLFSIANSFTTQVHFNAPGTYVLRLSSVSSPSTYDDVMINCGNYATVDHFVFGSQPILDDYFDIIDTVDPLDSYVSYQSDGFVRVWNGGYPENAGIITKESYNTGTYRITVELKLNFGPTYIEASFNNDAVEWFYNYITNDGKTYPKNSSSVIKSVGIVQCGSISKFSIYDVWLNEHNYDTFYIKSIKIERLFT